MYAIIDKYQFADLCDFTSMCTMMPPRDIVDLLESLFLWFDGLAEAHGLQRLKTIGRIAHAKA